MLVEIGSDTAERLLVAVVNSEEFFAKAPYICFDLAKDLLAVANEILKAIDNTRCAEDGKTHE